MSISACSSRMKTVAIFMQDAKLRQMARCPAYAAPCRQLSTSHGIKASE